MADTEGFAFHVFMGALALAALAACAPPTNLPPLGLPDTALEDHGPARELTNRVWLNTDKPLRLADLRGRVVLLDMWTFG